MRTDEELVLEFRQGSSDSFTELFHRYREPVYGFFCRPLSDPARAEELAQETFVAVLRGAQRYEPRASFRSYLYGIAFRQLTAEHRQQANRASQLSDLPAPETKLDPDAGLWVRQAMERLDADSREVLLLREYEQLSYAEMGALLRIPLNTVRSRLFRARMALKEQLVSGTATREGAA